MGPHFKQANNFLWTFKLRAPRGGFAQKRHPFQRRGDWGNRENFINDLVSRMLWFGHTYLNLLTFLLISLYIFVFQIVNKLDEINELLKKWNTIYRQSQTDNKSPHKKRLICQNFTSPNHWFNKRRITIWLCIVFSSFGQQNQYRE